MDEEFQVSYQAATPGIPVLTRDGQQFGLLEHVLAVEEQDIFEGIVVWTGGGAWAERQVQRELSRGHESAARFLESFQPGHLRFVPAGKVSVITVGNIRCDLSAAEAERLAPPSGPPVFYANAIDQAVPAHRYWNGLYGPLFGRARWRQE